MVCQTKWLLKTEEKEGKEGMGGEERSWVSQGGSREPRTGNQQTAAGERQRTQTQVMLENEGRPRIKVGEKERSRRREI